MKILVNRVIRKITGRPLERYCTNITEIYPAERLKSRPGIFFDSDIEKIKAVVNGDVRYQIAKARGEDEHFATRVLNFTNASIRGRYLISGLGVKEFRTSLGELYGDAPQVYDAAFLSTNEASGLEFGHWVRDCLVAEEYGSEQGLPRVAVGRNAWQHEDGFRRLADMWCSYGSNIFVANLTVIDDRGLNSFWADRFMQVRGRIQRKVAMMTGEAAGERIFMRRGGRARPREPRNIEAVETALHAMGFRTIVPTDMTVDEIAVALRKAKVVVSAEGSHLNHIHYFCPNNVKLLIIQNPWRFSVYHKRFIDINDGLLSFIVGIPKEASLYDIETNELLRLVDKIDRFIF